MYSMNRMLFWNIQIDFRSKEPDFRLLMIVLLSIGFYSLFRKNNEKDVAEINTTLYDIYWYNIT